jgi:hypothetical protein
MRVAHLLRGIIEHRYTAQLAHDESSRVRERPLPQLSHHPQARSRKAVWGRLEPTDRRSAKVWNRRYLAVGPGLGEGPLSHPIADPN